MCMCLCRDTLKRTSKGLCAKLQLHEDLLSALWLQKIRKKIAVRHQMMEEKEEML